MQSPTRARNDGDPKNLIPEIRKAMVKQDLEALARLYADDAVLEEVSSLNPPAHPIVVHGRDAILERFRAEVLHDPVAGWTREVKTTEILDGMETDEALAFTEIRTYVAGDKVVAQHIAQKKNGRIAHDRMVVARDAD